VYNDEGATWGKNTYQPRRRFQKSVNSPRCSPHRYTQAFEYLDEGGQEKDLAHPTNDPLQVFEPMQNPKCLRKSPVP